MSKEKTETIEHPMSDAYHAGLEGSKPIQIDGHIIHHETLNVTDILNEKREYEKRYVEGEKNRKGSITCHKIGSLIHAYTCYSTEQTKVYANLEDKEIGIIFDYLKNGDGMGRTSNGWKQFKAYLKLKYSRKLKEWNNLQNWTDQIDFANFIEDHLEDIVTPSGSDVLALATDLEANETSNFQGKVNLQSGDVKLNYQSDTATSITVPKTLELAIPIFEYGESYKLTVRLRFNSRGGNLKFKILFTNLDDVVDHHLDQIIAQFEEATKSTVFRGTLS